MIILQALGLFVFACTLGFGVYWVITNITFIRQAQRYKYEKFTDEQGNVLEKVIDITDNETT